MKHSVECRLPFQAISLVEFFIAMPNNYRFEKKKNQGKFFLRNYIREKIDDHISRRPKVGMGYNLFEKSENREKNSGHVTLQI